jgi:hypothetical protein
MTPWARAASSAAIQPCKTNKISHLQRWLVRAPLSDCVSMRCGEQAALDDVRNWLVPFGTCRPGATTESETG